jgi:hypothetical protein
MFKAAIGRNKSSSTSSNRNSPSPSSTKDSKSPFARQQHSQRASPQPSPSSRLSSSHSFASLISFRNNSTNNKTIPISINLNHNSYEDDEDDEDHLNIDNNDDDDNNTHHSFVSVSSEPPLADESALLAQNISPAKSSKVIDTVVAIRTYGSNSTQILSFQKGDILQVFLKLNSGWWDGVNPQGQRGWFPMEYTQPLNNANNSNNNINNTNSIDNQHQQQLFSKYNSNESFPLSNPIDPIHSSPSSPRSSSVSQFDNNLSPLIREQDLSQQQPPNQPIPPPTFNTRSFDPSDPLSPPSAAPIATSSSSHFTQFRRTSNNPSHLFNNVFDNDSDSITSNKTGEGTSRKGSIVSFMSSVTHSGTGSDASLPDTSATAVNTPSSDYRYIENITNVNINSDLTTHWIPQATKSSKLYFVNPNLKTFTSSLPFESVSEKAAANLAVSGLATSFEPPPDLSVSTNFYENSAKCTNADSSTFVLSRSADPYMDLVSLFFFFFFLPSLVWIFLLLTPVSS